MTNAHILEHSRSTDNPWFGIIEVMAVAGAVFLAAQVKIYLPWTPVPMTLQTLPVLAAAYVVGCNRAALGIGVYLLIGAMFQWSQTQGVPMFAAAFGPTIGFLIAFALVPFLTNSIRKPGFAILAATLLMYALGATWLCIWKGIGPIEGAMLAVLPFIPGDIAKGFGAYLIARRAIKNHELADGATGAPA